MTKAHPLEKDVKKGIKMVLDKHHIFWWMPPANGYGRSGISDFHAIRRGVFFAIEAKLDVTKNPPTQMQQGFLSSIKSENGFAFVVDADRLPVLDCFLTMFDNAAERVAKGEPENADEASMMLNCLRTLQWEVV